MCSDSELIFVPQTSRIIMEINFSVSFNANNLISNTLTYFLHKYPSSDHCRRTDSAAAISRESEECPCPDEGESSKLSRKRIKPVAVQTHYHQQTAPNGVFQGFWLTQLSKPAILINVCKSVSIVGLHPSQQSSSW